MSASRRDADDPTLRPEVADYLRSMRKKADLTQAKLAEHGEQLGIRFDESWVSKWERLGPRPGFLKSLAYLKLIDADLELLQEMLRAPMEFPESLPDNIDDVLTECRSLATEGRLAASLGLAVQAMRTSKLEPEPAVRLYLTAAIVARRADLPAFADYFAECARDALRHAPMDPKLTAKVLIGSANAAQRRGDTERAQRFLEQIPETALTDPMLTALTTHTRAYVEDQGVDFEKSLSLYPGKDAAEVAPLLLAGIAIKRARSGALDSAVEAIRQAERLAEREGAPILQVAVLQHAGRVYTLANRRRDALRALRRAEELAEQLHKPLRLFDIRLAMLELAQSEKDAALAKMLTRRLTLDRQQLTLPSDLAQAYARVVEHGPPPAPA